MPRDWRTVREGIPSINLDWSKLGRERKAVQPDRRSVLKQKNNSNSSDISLNEFPDVVMLRILSLLLRDEIRKLLGVCMGLNRIVKCYIGEFMKTHFPNYHLINEDSFRLSLAKKRILRANIDIYSAQFSPDGMTIVSRTLYSFHVWSVATGRCVKHIYGHNNLVRSVQFSPDGQNIVSASDDQTARVWRVATGECVQTLHGHSAGVNFAQFSPNGQSIVSASDDHTVRIWGVATAECTQILEGHTSMVNSAQFSPDGTKVVSGSLDETVRIWDVVRGECEQTLLAHSSYVMSTSFSPNGQSIVFAEGQNMDREPTTVQVWNTARPWEPMLILEGHKDTIWTAQFSPDGQSIVSASRDKTVCIWSVATGKCVQTLKHSCKVGSAQFSPDGQSIIICRDDKTMQIWYLN